MTPLEEWEDLMRQSTEWIRRQDEYMHKLAQQSADLERMRVELEGVYSAVLKWREQTDSLHLANSENQELHGLLIKTITEFGMKLPDNDGEDWKTGSPEAP